MISKETLKVSIVQMYSETGRMLKNAKVMVEHIKKAKTKNADIVLFPEWQLCNYDVDQFMKDPDSMAVTEEDESIKCIQDACLKNGIHAVFGAVVKYDDGFSNSAFVINKLGEIVSIYDKCIKWCFGEEYMKHQGDALEIYNIDGFKLGIAICYECGFPEHFRTLALEGVDGVLTLNAFALNDEENRYHLYWPLSAVQNTIYIIVANAIGEAGSRSHLGKSKVVDPNGRILREADRSEGMITVTINKERLRNVRRDFTYLQDIRNEVYGRPTPKVRSFS